MQSKKDLFDDLATMATGAMSTGLHLREQIEEEIRNHIKEFLDRQDFALKDDIVKMEKMLKKARLEIEDLKAKITELEKQNT